MFCVFFLSVNFFWKALAGAPKYQLPSASWNFFRSRISPISFFSCYTPVMRETTRRMSEERFCRKVSIVFVSDGFPWLNPSVCV